MKTNRAARLLPRWGDATRNIAFVAFFFSGTSSLIFQSIWSRMLHHVFGATTIAVSSVVTVFMAGLGLGAWLTGKYADRIKHPIITYAVAELGVGAWALLVPLLVQPNGWLAGVNAALRNSLGAESLGFMLARFACVLPILLVPTTLMGSTLPLLARHFVQSEQRAGVVASRVGVLYAINTFGAVFGVALGAFILLPTVGLAVTNIVALSINFLLAAGIFLARGPLLRGTWQPGEKLHWRPDPRPAAEAAPGDGSTAAAETARTSEAATEESDQAIGAAGGSGAVDQGTKGKHGKKRGKKSDRRGHDTKTGSAVGTGRGEKRNRGGDDEPDFDRGSSDVAMPIPAIARWAAFLTFGASGAAALCYEVVWTRALAMTIGSSIYSFALILMTFLIGIAGGSALCASFFSASKVRLSTVGVIAVLLNALAATGWGLERDVYTWFLLTVVFTAPVAVVWGAVLARSRAMAGSGANTGTVAPVAAMLAVPAIAGIVTAAFYPSGLTMIVATVVVLIAALPLLIAALRRYPVLLLAIVQLFIAIATFANYYFQDDIPCAFAALVSSLPSITDELFTVQFFMFLTAGLCTLPATMGMGAMFPLTMRIWTGGGHDVGRDVGIVYTGNTVGSIVGAWLPGFVLMPLIGIERTLHVGMVLNLLLALLMLIASAAEPERATQEASTDGKTSKEGVRDPGGRPQVPVWHAVSVYVLAPLIPALIALLYLGTSRSDSFLRWNPAQMTLGVFRLSIAGEACDDSMGSPDVVYYRDGLSTTVTVERYGRHFALKNNGKVDASNGDDMPTQIMVAGFPLLMHRDGPEDLDVAVVGFGSGMSVGTTLEFPVRSVDVIELERSVPEASQYFADVNHLEYPHEDFPYVAADRLTVINDDGRNYLAATDRRYDIIMSEPSNPWITGVSDLFTTDHFRITKQRLKPNGIYCQWVQLYELSPENIKTIYRTFAEQFAYVIVFSAEEWSSDTVLLGSDAPLDLDLAHLREVMAAPAIRDELERAYIHSPFDVMARTMLGNKEEVLSYTRIESRLRGGQWVVVPDSSNAPDSECRPSNCRRDPAPLNTDDNALIEFAAPRDLIGYERYEGYLLNIYSPDWPYGRLGELVAGFGGGEEAARNYAELSMSLLAHGRKVEAAQFVRRSLDTGEVREALVASHVLAMLISDDDEPTAMLEPPVPGPEMDRETARQLAEGFAAVRASVDLGAYSTALTAMEEIPSPIRLHSGPSMRFLYGYLLYKAAGDHLSRYRQAIDNLEDLLRSDEEYARGHPEIHYFLGRAHDADGNFDKALRNMRAYVEAARVPAGDPQALPEPPLGEAPTTDAPGEAPKDLHPDRT